MVTKEDRSGVFAVEDAAAVAADALVESLLPMAPCDACCDACYRSSYGAQHVQDGELFFRLGLVHCEGYN